MSDEEDPVVIDLDDDIQPPPSHDDDSEGGVEKDVVVDNEGGGKKPFIDPQIFKFSDAELPVLGYSMACLVFFFASVGKKASTTLDLNLGLRKLLAESSSNRKLEDLAGLFGGIFSQAGLSPSQYAYALCLSLIGCVMGLGVLVWMRFSAHEVEQRSGDEEGSEDARITTDADPNAFDKARPYINILLCIWAVVGWAIFTFDDNGIFSVTGNGFFALWAMMLFSVWNLGVDTKSLVEDNNSDSCIYGMALTSLVALIELSVALSDTNFMANNIVGCAAFGLFVAIGALIYGLFVFYVLKLTSKSMDLQIQFWTVLAFLLLWSLAACLTTFVGPFLNTRNGYFAVWGSVAFAALAFKETRNEMKN